MHIPHFAGRKKSTTHIKPMAEAGKLLIYFTFIYAYNIYRRIVSEIRTNRNAE